MKNLIYLFLLSTLVSYQNAEAKNTGSIHKDCENYVINVMKAEIDSSAYDLLYADYYIDDLYDDLEDERGIEGSLLRILIKSELESPSRAFKAKSGYDVDDLYDYIKDQKEKGVDDSILRILVKSELESRPPSRLLKEKASDICRRYTR